MNCSEYFLICIQFLKDFLQPSVKSKVEHDMKTCNIVLVVVAYEYILGAVTE